MTFLPLGIPRGAAGGRPAFAGDLVQEVRTAASDLVIQLAEAERLTSGWSDDRLADALIDAAISQCLVRLAATECWGEGNRLPSSELWQIAGPVLELGSLQRHARFKPHGYAGDYEMLTRICEESTCGHPLGRLFDRYFLRQTAPQAVRARTQQTATALVAHCLRRPPTPYRIVSVGAGPAMDICQAIAILPIARRNTIQVRLLDLDPNALDAARGRLQPCLSSGSLDCIRGNLFRLAQAARGAREIGQPDFLICTGLFDYLDVEAATGLLSLFWRQLAEGGVLLVGNFAPHNPSRAYMEWIGNWYLKYRTIEEMERLATLAGIPRPRFRIGCDRTGADLFLIASKRSRTVG